MKRLLMLAFLTNAIALPGLLDGADGGPPSPPSPISASELGERIDTMIAPYTELGDFSGTILVAEGGQVLYTGGFGWANREHQVPNEPTTRFLIGSISKQFAAAAILLLEEDRRLRVTDPVSRHLPDYPRGDEITLHHLLTHTSGIPDLYTLDGYAEWKHRDPTLATAVSLFRDLPLESEPGSQYSYCNSGYTLLAWIVETVSGLTYAQFLRERIFIPLDMQNSGTLSDRRVIPGLATGYDPVGRTDLRRAIQVAPGLMAGSGSVFSTAEDLLRWDRALAGEGLLTADARDRMTTNHGHGYGYGVSVYSRFGGTVIEHDGRLPGYACDLARYVERDATVIILGNIQSAVRDRFRDDIAALLHGEEPEPREMREPSDRSAGPDPDGALAGFYDFGPNFFVAVRVGHDRLFLRANQGEESEFFPAGDGVFFSRTLYAGARFEWGDAGHPEAMEYLRGSRSFRGTRREDPAGDSADGPD